MNAPCSHDVRKEPAAAIRIPAEVAKWLAAVQDRISRRDPAGALEAIAGAAILDIQRHQQTFLAAAPQAGYVADLYAAALAQAGLPAWTPAEWEARAGRGPLRVGYFTGSVAQGQSASATLARFARLHDRVRVEMHVIVTEEFTQRIPPLRMLQLPWAPSHSVGAAVLAEIQSAGVPVHVVPARGSYLDGSLAAIGLARRLELDLAVFVGGPACAIQATCCVARVAPRQVNFHIGVPLLTPGMDAIIYSNPARQREDAAFVESRGIRALGVPTSGGDVGGGIAVAPTTRAELRIPDGATALVSASNKLPERMLHGTFARDLAAFLVSHPEVWWVGIGRGDFGGVMQAMRAAGVEDRVVLTGPSADIRRHVKACDVYLNEYPEGGCNTVMEAMGCGIPVAAVTAGSRHAEMIGAELVGEHAARDLAGYWAMVERWARDPEERRRVGASQRERGLLLLDYPAACRNYEQRYEEVCGRARS